MSEDYAGWRDNATITDVLSRARVAGYDTSRVAGFSIGGCADAHGTDRVGAMRRSAHSHTAAGWPLRGYICFKGGTARMTHTLVTHEVAHILTWAGHTKAWRECVAALGHPAEARKYVR